MHDSSIDIEYLIYHDFGLFVFSREHLLATAYAPNPQGASAFQRILRPLLGWYQPARPSYTSVVQHTMWTVHQALHNSAHTLHFCALISFPHVAAQLVGMAILVLIRSNIATEAWWRSGKGWITWWGLRLLDERTSSRLIARVVAPWVYRRQGDAVLGLSSMSLLAGIIQVAVQVALIIILDVVHLLLTEVSRRLWRENHKGLQKAWMVLALLIHMVSALQLRLIAVTISQVLFP